MGLFWPNIEILLGLGHPITGFIFLCPSHPPPISPEAQFGMFLGPITRQARFGGHAVRETIAI